MELLKVGIYLPKPRVGVARDRWDGHNIIIGKILTLLLHRQRQRLRGGKAADYVSCGALIHYLSLSAATISSDFLPASLRSPFVTFS